MTWKKRAGKITVYDGDEPQQIDIWHRDDDVYTVYVNGEYYVTLESRAQVDEEVSDIMSLYRWSYIRPMW